MRCQSIEDLQLHLSDLKLFLQVSQECNGGFVFAANGDGVCLGVPNGQG
jgi:hypothetical protein